MTKPVIAFTHEGWVPGMGPDERGWVAECRGCGWLVWKQHRGDTDARAKDHKCKGGKKKDE
ncbi:hypothetical protein [Nocardioides nanhaiensis]|uniref:Zinc-ribbon domain-containing protein n=1 Tax=Nocardioides nanhaiensis TaxID=1476871 RepID=A0ABP8W6I0_9ACTN